MNNLNEWASEWAGEHCKWQLKSHLLIMFSLRAFKINPSENYCITNLYHSLTPAATHYFYCCFFECRVTCSSRTPTYAGIYSISQSTCYRACGKSSIINMYYIKWWHSSNDLLHCDIVKHCLYWMHLTTIPTCGGKRMWDLMSVELGFQLSHFHAGKVTQTLGLYLSICNIGTLATTVSISLNDKAVNSSGTMHGKKSFANWKAKISTSIFQF